MGSGIVQVAASNGLKVVMNDISTEFVDKGFATIDNSLSRMVNKDKISSQEKNDIISRIKGSTDISDMKQVDFLVEAATENEQLKLKIFSELDDICKTIQFFRPTHPQSLLQNSRSNKRPQKVIGMHFMNPVPVMKLVEIIRGLATSDETNKITNDLALKLKKYRLRLMIFLVL